MNLKRLALCLLVCTGLMITGTMEANASSLTENETATSEQNQNETQWMEGEETEANVEYGGQKEKTKYTNADLRLMSAIIYCEANGESYAGKKAVGIVVMNRVKSKSYPNTLKGVIYQKGQFGPVRNGSLNRALANWDAGRFQSSAAKQCVKAAKEALNGDAKVKVGGKTKNMSGYRYFSGRMRNARYRIGRHLFK